MDKHGRLTSKSEFEQYIKPVLDGIANGTMMIEELLFDSLPGVYSRSYKTPFMKVRADEHTMYSISVLYNTGQSAWFFSRLIDDEYDMSYGKNCNVPHMPQVIASSVHAGWPGIEMYQYCNQWFEKDVLPIINKEFFEHRRAAGKNYYYNDEWYKIDSIKGHGYKMRHKWMIDHSNED